MSSVGPVSPQPPSFFTRISQAALQNSYVLKVGRLAQATLSAVSCVNFKMNFSWIKGIFNYLPKIPVIFKRCQHNSLLKSRQEIAPSRVAWHTNLALLREAFQLAKDPETKRKIEFIAMNYLDKISVVDPAWSKDDFKDFENIFNLHAEPRFHYHRSGFKSHPKVLERIRDQKGINPLVRYIPIETDENLNLFSLKFHCISRTDDKWLEKIVQAIEQRILETSNDLSDLYLKIFETPILLELPMFVGLLGKGDENTFKSKLKEIEEEIISKVSQAFPNLDQHGLRMMVRGNFVGYCKVTSENMSGIAILALLKKDDERINSGAYNRLLTFIENTGLLVDPVQFRKYESKGIFQKYDTDYGVRGENVAYFPSKEDIQSILKTFQTEFSHSENEGVRILGENTVRLLQGWLSEISDAHWAELNRDPAKRMVLQTSLVKIHNQLRHAHHHQRDFKSFALQMELIHSELATLLEVFSPYQRSDYSEIAVKSFTMIPEKVQRFVKTALNKSASNTFAYILLILRGMFKDAAIIHTENLYFEHLALLNKKNQFDEIMKNDQVTTIDLHVTQFNPPLNPDLKVDHYVSKNIAEDIRSIFSRKVNTKQLTVVIDCTVDYHNSEKVNKLLSEFENEIRGGKLNFIFIRSGQKYDMFGMDNYFGSPLLVVNNGNKHWRVFDALLENPKIQSDHLSLQWFCLAFKYASKGLDDYRSRIFKNVREILTKIPSILRSNKSSHQDIKISTFDNNTEAFFIEIKFDKGNRNSSYLRDLFKKLENNGFKGTRRISFGFNHLNFTQIDDSFRITPGINPSENRTVMKYLSIVAFTYIVCENFWGMFNCRSPEDPPVILSNFLKKRNIPLRLEGINLSRFKKYNIDFSDMHLVRCKVDYAVFPPSKFNNVTFEDCIEKNKPPAEVS